MSSGLLVLLLLCGVGIGGNIFSDADSVECLLGPCNVCPPTWSSFGSRCYLFVNTKKNWDDAEQYCTDHDAHLTSIHGHDEYNFIKKLIISSTGINTIFWVGGTDAEEEGVWTWSDGSKFSDVPWGNGEPNNLGGNENCMDINTDGDYINDEVCAKENAFVCAQDA